MQSPSPSQDHVSRAAPANNLLASHDGASLAAYLVAAGGTASSARSAASRILRYVFSKDSAVPWDASAFASLGIGGWAHAALSSLDPSPSLSLAETVRAEDGTIRLLFRASFDGALIESVLIPAPTRTTLCISSQVGCARACRFCETGRLGLLRQLSAGEIVDQIRLGRRVFAEMPNAKELSNIVFMGMGEPFDNLPEVLRSIRLLTDHHAFAFAPSRITVSTVGVLDKLPAFFAGSRAELAVSLNAPDDARRASIMPINNRFPLQKLREALLATLPAGRRVLFEYVLFDHVNDAPEDADLVAELTKGIRCRINVIPCNPGPDPALRPPTSERLDAFVARLSSHQVTTLVRRPRGRDVGGACGQLAGARRLPLAP